MERTMCKIKLLQRSLPTRGAVGLLPRRNRGGTVTALPLFVHRQARIGTAYRARHW
ncbi:hypothetical protein MES4922_160041 [Mesorhizobium ventifaucium]|uniref:Uncharacterized protein n=1 Tax=Mesorhizobium ventifaucium TaxID=666020 RepID=A0ABN8JF34_9HYPH|nr:hypothetical protein MES4922_160041 [Mesorhizobium ventifaucium]